MVTSSLVPYATEYIRVSGVMQLFVASATLLCVSVGLFAAVELTPKRKRNIRRAVPPQIAWIVGISAFLFSLQYSLGAAEAAEPTGAIRTLYVMSLSLFAVTAAVVSQGQRRSSLELAMLCVFAAGLSTLSITASQFSL